MGATLVHEAGHGIAARLKGGRVIRIQIGRGPIVWRVERAGTEYALAPLPFGGRIHFDRVTPGTAEAVVAVSGAVANVLVGVCLFAVGAFLLGPGGMPGHIGGSALAYALDRVGAWLWWMPRLIGSGVGLTAGPGVSVTALPVLLRESGVAGALYVAAAVSTLWGVLNLVPLPGLRTDGWQFIRALVKSFRATGPRTPTP